ncbi:MAG: hypothetical protein K8T10_22045 [Candidatus Eremiobacteraeota bacterium]|nr:hypothetical protein [Candidatus Eremiobacteraeota bacterium]
MKLITAKASGIGKISDNVEEVAPKKAIIDMGGLPITHDSRVEKMVRNKNAEVRKELEEAERQRIVYGFD